MNIDLFQLALWGFFLLALVTYGIASAVLIYHLFKFGLNQKTAMTSSIVYLVASGLIITILFAQVIFISFT